MSLRSFLSSPFFAGLLIGSLTTGAAAEMLGSAVFPDIEQGSYYDAAVGRLYGAGIIKGAGDGNYRPADYVTRADIAVMLDRALSGGGFTASSSSRSSRSSRSVVSSSSSVASESSSSTVSSSSAASSVTAGTAGALRFSVDHIAFPESASNVSLAIQRYGGAKGAATVKYTTVDGTAKAGTRYNQAAGVVSFADGETSKIIALKFINNLIAEPNETFTVTLSNATGDAVIGTPATITLTILDNDGGGGNSTTTSSSSSSSSSGTSGSASSAPGGNISFSAWAYGVDEKAGNLTVNVLRKGTVSAAVNVDYATSDGTATAGVNYSTARGTLGFAANETSKTFSVPVIHQASIDGNKSLTMKLSSPTGGAVLDTPNSVTLTVVDNEANASSTGSVLFSSDTYAVNFTDTSVLVTVYRRGGYQGSVSVNFATSDSSAIAGADYTTTTGTLTFAPGESSKIFTVPIKTTKFTGSKRVNLTLSGITGPATLGTQGTAAITIQGQ